MEGDYSQKQPTTVKDLECMDGVLIFHSDDSGECPSLSTANSPTLSGLVTEIQQSPLVGVYRTKRQIATWSKQEVAELEKLVWAHGTDFAIIASFLNKDRDQVKRKFKQQQKLDNTFGFKEPQ